MVYCIAEFTPKTGRMDELFDKLQKLEEATRLEKGCNFYKVMKKIKSGYAEGKSHPIIFNEQWETQEDFETHCDTQHIQEFFENECISDSGSAEDWNVNLFE